MERSILKKTTFKWFLIFLTLALLAGGFFIWRIKYIPSKIKFTFFFADKDGLFLIPITRTFSKQISVPEIMNEWIKGPHDTAHLLGLVPPGVSIKDIRQTNSKWNITFSEELEKHFREDFTIKEIFTAALLNTLSPIVKPNELLIRSANGDELYPADLNGSKLGELNLNQGESDPDLTGKEEETRIRLYFLSKDTRYLVPILRDLPKENDAVAQIITEELKGPYLHDLLDPPFPPGTAINSIKLEGKTLYITPSEEFSLFVTRDSKKSLRAVLALVLTVTELPQIQRVCFIKDGKPMRFVKENANGGTEISNWPLIWQRPSIINEEVIGEN